MTNITFDLRIGGGSLPLIGGVSFTPTRILHSSTSVTMPEPQIIGLHNGKGIMEKVTPTPPGASPAWAYRAEVIDGVSGDRKSWLVTVPDVHTIDFDDLSRPVQVVTPTIDLEALAESVDGATKSISVGTDGEVTVTRMDGSTYTAGNASGPAGPVGPSGGPIPVGGTAGQIPLKTADGGARWAEPTEIAPRPNLIAGIKKPTIIAHRSARNVYPEMSLEGARAAAADGYIPEIDVKALADGTLICLHDTTVNRTMTGQTGAPGLLTPEQWLNMRIKPAIAGGKDALPYLLDTYLDELGGTIPLVIELKDPTPECRDALALAITSRNLHDAVVLQTREYDFARVWADQGLHVLYLLTGSPTPEELVSAGFEYLGVGGSTSAATIAAMKAAGLTVWAYTINTPAGLQSWLDKGVDGVFTDDPWRITRRFATTTGDPFAAGYGWPGVRGYAQQGTTLAAYEPALAGNALDLRPVLEYGGSKKIVYQDWAGEISLPCRIDMRIKFGSNVTATDRHAGIVLYRNTLDPEADWYDGTKPGQEAICVVARRSGALDGWKYLNGAAAFKTLAVPASTVFAQPGKPGLIDLSVTVSTAGITVEVPQYGISEKVDHAYDPGGPLRLAIRGSNDMSALVSDVRVTRL